MTIAIDGGLGVSSLPIGGQTGFDYYVDSNAGGSGDGTRQSPYDDFTEIQALYDATGSGGTQTYDGVDGLRIGVARGSEFNGEEILDIKGSHRFTLEAYGTGDRPLFQFKKADPLTTDFADLTGGHYTITTVNDDGGGNPLSMSLFIDGVWFSRQATQADAAATENSYWLDTATSLQHVYSSTVDPTSASTIETAGEGYVLNFSSVSNTGRYTENLKIKGIEVRHGTAGVFIGNGYDNVTIDDCLLQCSHEKTGPTSMPLYMNGSKASLVSSTGLRVRNTTVRYSDDQLLLTRNQQDTIYTDCIFDAPRNSVNEWKSDNTDITFNRCMFLNVGQGEGGFGHKITDDDTGDLQNIKMINCLFHAPWREYQKALQSGTKMGANFIKVEAGVSAEIKLVNCTLFTENFYIIDIAPTATAEIRVINSILALYEREGGGFDGGGRGFYYCGDYDEFSGTSSQWGDDVDTNNNLYHQYTSQARQFTVATINTSWSTWTGDTVAPDADSLFGYDPLFGELSEDGDQTLDMTIPVTSPAIGLASTLDTGGAVDPDVPSVDIAGTARRSTFMAAGCYTPPQIDYVHDIAVTEDDGYYTLGDGSWTDNNSANLVKGFSAGLQNAGFSFPSVNIANGTTVTSAYFIPYVLTVTATCNVDIFVHEPLAESARWSSSNLPLGGSAWMDILSNQSGALGRHVFDITALANNVFSHESWASGDWFNVAIRANSGTLSGDIEYGGVGGGDVLNYPARLVIVL